MKGYPSYLNLLLSILALLFFSACSEKEDLIPADSAVFELSVPECDGPAVVARKVYIENGHKYLWGGESTDMRFDITSWNLDECKLNQGQGREDFSALLEPEYVPMAGHENDFSASERCLVLRSVESVKIFPFQTMLSYEVVNETADGVPVMIAYCVLADLAEVYTRTYCGQELHFAVSGYTYADASFCDGIYEQCIGLRAFVLWDRETESLWWPLINEGVSGLMRDRHMMNHSSADWEVITWGEVLNQYPQSLLLRAGQEMDIPVDWPRLDAQDLNCN
jgi:hypothetical protein